MRKTAMVWTGPMLVDGVKFGCDHSGICLSVLNWSLTTAIPYPCDSET